MNDLQLAMRELNAIKADLAALSEAMAPYRMRRRQVQDRIAAACVKCDDATRTVTWWRPPTPAEVAQLDDVNAWAAAGLAPLAERERALKEAARLAEISVRDARSATTEKPRKDRGKIGQHAFRSSPRFPKVTTDRGRGSVVLSASADEPRNESVDTLWGTGGNDGFQGELF